MAGWHKKTAQKTCSKNPQQTRLKKYKKPLVSSLSSFLRVSLFRQEIWIFPFNRLLNNRLVLNYNIFKNEIRKITPLRSLYFSLAGCNVFLRLEIIFS
jgi:hypothetical protein